MSGLQTPAYNDYSVAKTGLASPALENVILDIFFYIHTLYIQEYIL